jgi:hypothetical protein
VVVPIDDQLIAPNELLSGQLKGRKQGPSNAKGGKGTGYLLAEYMGRNSGKVTLVVPLKQDLVGGRWPSPWMHTSWIGSNPFST